MLQDIIEKDYNLNIPRYVDTFEAEDSIDVNAIARELMALDKEMATTDKAIEEFCAALKIETPF